MEDPNKNTNPAAAAEEPKKINIVASLDAAISEAEALRGTHMFGTALSAKLDRLYALKRRIKAGENKKATLQAIVQELELQ